MLFIICIGTTSCYNGQSKIAELYIKNDSINIGTVAIKDTITKTIYLKNNSSNQLKIDSVGVSCGCTIISFDKHPISKNDSLALTINFIPDELGSFKKSIMIDANTNPPFTELHLIGEVK